MKKGLLILIAFVLIFYRGYSEVAEYKGLFNFSYDENSDKIILEVQDLNKEFLYVSSLATGIGSNDLGLDRGKLSNTRIVKFQKAGNKLLLVQPNYDYRAESDNKDEIRAVDEAFAISVIGGFKIEKTENETYFIDITDFLMQDEAGIIQTLKQNKQGTYKLNKTRSAVYLPNTKNFPKNTEFEVLLTYTGTPEGRLIRSVTPSSDAVTVRQHHSFIELPDNNYQPREFDPRAGFFSTSYADYATSFTEPVTKRFINRHRLEKKNPELKISEPVEPIIYYVDRGTPEPVKSALIKGAGWWNQAFEAAGFKDAFIVKEMPEGADMLDIRYNVIQWVHRSTRGWSYGATVTDPRTGEIIKGHVSLGSLRIRQDYMIAQGLLSPFGKNPEKINQAEEMALARIRQLAAHEAGHTIGLAHAYSSSSEGRTSVMDYPHPLIELKNGKIDLTNAYDDKIGDWDKVAITYGYSDFPEGSNEKNELEKILKDSRDKGLSFLSDQTSADGAHPFTHQWDNGIDATEELNKLLKIRKIALNNFGENTIPKGAPYAELEKILVPVYYLHRYQITASAKLLGGLNYRYALKGDGQLITELIPAEKQKEALNTLLACITPENLAIPEKLIHLIPPQPMGYRRTNEMISTKTGVTFDPIGAAEALSNMVYSELLTPERAMRLIEYQSLDKNIPGFDYVLEEILQATWKSKKESGINGELQKTSDNAFLLNLINLVANERASDLVKAIAWSKLQDLKLLFAQKSVMEQDAGLKAHFSYGLYLIDQFEKFPEKFKSTQLVSPPPGAPIGMD